MNRPVVQETLTDLRSVRPGEHISFVGAGASWYYVTRTDEDGLWGIFQTIWGDVLEPNDEKFICSYDQFPNNLDPVKVKFNDPAS